MYELKPAINYEEELRRNFNELLYSEDYLLYYGGLGWYQLDLSTGDEDGVSYHYAIIENGRVIGYITYRVDWYSQGAYNFGLISFDRGNANIGRALYSILDKLINEYHLHRIEYRMIDGNPVERHYDRFCNRYNGRKLRFRDCFKDRKGNYRDEFVYEILF